MNPISQDAEPQPSPSSSLNRCLQLYWVKEITDADYFMHRGGGGNSPNVLTVVLCMKENMSSGIFAERSCQVPSKGRQRFTSQSKATEDCEVLLVSGHKKHSEEHHRQPPNTGLPRHSTGSARDNLCINHKLPSPKAAVLEPAHTAYDSHPKAMAVWPLCHSGSPDWFSFRYFPLLQNTRN